MKKTVVIIQARLSSTRLPGKVMKNLSGRPMLWQVIARCQKSKLADQVIVATTERSEDAVIEGLCRKMGTPCFKGSLANVLERYYRAATEIRADVVVRITSDCPLIDPVIIDLCLNEFAKNKYDYISNVLPGDRTFPRGLDVEVFSFSTLRTAFEKATENLETEHVTPYIWQNKKGHFTIGPMIMAPLEYRRDYRLVVDYPEDFLLLEKIYKVFNKEAEIIHVPSVLVYLDQHQEVAKLNEHCEQKPMK